MRETIASTWIYQLVIVFILMFVAFLILSLTYSKNYKTKNELINIIEKYEGVNVKSVQIMNNYLEYNNYSVKGHCPEGSGWKGVTDLQSTKLEDVSSSTKYYYCVKKKWSNKDYKNQNKKGTIVKSKMFYQIKIFFKFNLPVVGDIHTFTIDGTTNDIFEGVDLFTKTN